MENDGSHDRVNCRVNLPVEVKRDSRRIRVAFPRQKFSRINCKTMPLLFSIHALARAYSNTPTRGSLMELPVRVYRNP